MAIPNFDRLQSATRKAFDRIGKVTGTETDPDLSLYNSLKPEHFTGLMREYGEDEIIGYIREMENRRLGGKRNA
jgi:hypothetical protein